MNIEVLLTEELKKTTAGWPFSWNFSVSSEKSKMYNSNVKCKHFWQLESNEK